MAKSPSPSTSAEVAGASIRIEPVWILPEAALAAHDRQLAEHGGGIGARDMGALDSALVRPRNRWEYGEDDLAVLAAACAFGIARNHPFVDGNKRTAWVVARGFLRINGLQFEARPLDVIETVLALAAGDLPEDELADWLRQHLSAA
jgi:death on curing protein